MDKQSRAIRKTIVIVLIFIAIVLAAFFYAMTSPRIMSVKELVSNGAITFEAPKSIGDFELLTHSGQRFGRENLDDQWTLLFFGFTHCHHFCPSTLALLNEFYGQLQPDIRSKTQVVMVTADPARDSVDVLARYVPAFNPAFLGVTGEFLPIKLLANQLDVPFQKPVNAGDDYQVAHGENIVLINPRGEYQGFFRSPHGLARLKTAYQSIVLSYR